MDTELLFFYVPNESIYYVDKDSDISSDIRDEPPSLREDLSFRFPDVSHYLNNLLAHFFDENCGFFYYDSSVMYTCCPPQIISWLRFTDLADLHAHVVSFLQTSWVDSHLSCTVDACSPLYQHVTCEVSCCSRCCI